VQKGSDAVHRFAAADLLAEGNEQTGGVLLLLLLSAQIHDVKEYKDYKEYKSDSKNYDDEKY
jgi:hypothetical protein